MSFQFVELANEVKRRSTKDQGGTQFDTAIKNAINTSIFRIGKECPWLQMRRKHVIPTVGQYTTGVITAVNGSNSFTSVGATLLTNNVTIGRRVLIGGSSQRYVITSITGETTFTTNLNYDGTSASGLSMTIYGQEEYNMPINVGRIGLVWHEAFGFPYQLEYITDNDFYHASVPIENMNIPIYYRMWGDDWTIDQPLAASVMTIASSSSSDVSKSVTVFGDVAGYPDYEIITTDSSDGTTPVSGSKSFQNVERIVKSATTVGRITVTANTGSSTISVLPVGNTTSGLMYRKFQVWPLPKDVYNINIQYYKEPMRLVNDGDIHEFGQEFDEAIILLASSKIKFQENQKEGDSYYSLYKDELAILRRYNMDRNLDWKPTLKRPSQKRGSRGFLNKNVIWQQLGGQYGTQSWR
jgi:hypothetical protein